MKNAASKMTQNQMISCKFHIAPVYILDIMYFLYFSFTTIDSFCQDVVSYGYIGERTDISCRYPPVYSSKTKDFCKVCERGICNSIATGPRQRFGFEDDKFSKVATLTLRRVADWDSGIYRCGFATSEDRVDIQSIQFWGELHSCLLCLLNYKLVK